MTPLEAAQAVVDQLDELKRQIEAAPRVDDLTWQYASGQVAGARLVLRAIRESGGSLPERGGLLRPKSEGFNWANGYDPPVLNKSGGSDVDGGDAECVHDWRPYFAHLVCTKCGAAQRGAAGG